MTLFLWSCADLGCLRRAATAKNRLLLGDFLRQFGEWMCRAEAMSLHGRDAFYMLSRNAKLKRVSRGTWFSLLPLSLHDFFFIVVPPRLSSLLFFHSLSPTLHNHSNVSANNQARQLSHAPELHRRDCQIRRRVQIGMPSLQILAHSITGNNDKQEQQGGIYSD